VVVATIGLLASVAFGAYQGQQKSDRAAIILQYFANSKSLIEARFNQAHADRTAGVPVRLPATATEWIAEISPQGSVAPSGGAAFVAGTGNPATGAVGIQYTGSFAAGDAQVVLHRPTYSGVAALSTTIAL